MKMTDPKILFNNISNLRDLLVSLDFNVGQFGRGGVFAHDSIGNFVEKFEKRPPPFIMSFLAKFSETERSSYQNFPEKLSH